MELAGAIAKFSRYTPARDFRSINPKATHITLVEIRPRLLSGFAEDISAYAKARLERLGVHARTGEAVEDVGPTSVSIAGQEMSVGLVIWAAGVAAAREAARRDRQGRTHSRRQCAQGAGPGQRVRARGCGRVDGGGRQAPGGLAQVAKQQGIHLGRSLAAHIQSGVPLPPFRYTSRGNTAIVGRHAAVFEQGRFKVRGRFAWLAWAVIHVYLLVGFQHRFLVSMQFWRYLTYDRGARLIAGDNAEVEDPATGPLPRDRLRPPAPAPGATAERERQPAGIPATGPRDGRGK